MSSEGNPGINKLAAALCHRMKEESASPLTIDFGTIGSDYSLQTNTFPVSIPKSDYTLCKGAAAQGISPNSRVLVAWVDNDAVIIDLIIPASNL